MAKLENALDSKSNDLKHLAGSSPVICIDKLKIIGFHLVRVQYKLCGRDAKRSISVCETDRSGGGARLSPHEYIFRKVHILLIKQSLRLTIDCFFDIILVRYILKGAFDGTSIFRNQN